MPIFIDGILNMIDNIYIYMTGKLNIYNANITCYTILY